MKTIQEKLAHADCIATVVEFLSQAKANDFISTPVAAGIFKDVLRATGFKEDTKVIKAAPAHKTEEK